MTYVARLRRRLQQTAPYLSIVMLTVPFAFAEPVKIAALYVIGKGSWLTGIMMLITAYAISIYIVERLFRVLKPKLMTLEWFAVLWNWFSKTREGIADWVFHPKEHRLQSKQLSG